VRWRGSNPASSALFQQDKQLIEHTHTRTGLCVTVDILEHVYETGRKAAQHLKTTLNIALDALLPKWNYTISPQASP
jgi:hypothetical protein